jgi:formate C-acetyltransferase
VLKSAAKIDHLRTGGTLLNQKFTPQLLADEGSITKLAHMIRAYFKMDAHHIQFNLIVRVAGYSDYFVDLGRSLQDEIIRRTEHDQG